MGIAGIVALVEVYIPRMNASELPWPCSIPYEMTTAFVIPCSFMLSFLLADNSALAQSIVAGEFGIEDYYHNVEPDALFATWDPVSYPIDINGDGQNDLYVTSDRTDWDAGHSSQVQISCISGASLAREVPICGVSAAYRFLAGDTIGPTSAEWFWCGLALAYSYTEYGVSECDFSTFLSTGYLGVRLVEDQDTLYGWVMMQATSSPSFNVSEFACESGANAVVDRTVPSNCFNYIMERNELVLLFGSEPSGVCSIDVYDAQGRLALTRSTMLYAGHNSLFVPGLVPELYTAYVRDAQGYLLNGRFVVH